MPIIIVQGFTTSTKSYDLKDLYEAIIKEVCSIPELELKENQVSCKFPTELTFNGWSKEIFIFVEALFEKPERTETVRKLLASKLVRCVRKHFPNVGLIECFVKPFDPKSGFASNEK
jgi:hypothetical protein